MVNMTRAQEKAGEFYIMAIMTQYNNEPCVNTTIEVHNGQELERTLTVRTGEIVQVDTKNGILYGRAISTKLVTKNNTTGKEVVSGKINYSAWFEDGKKVIDICETARIDASASSKEGYVLSHTDADTRFMKEIEEVIGEE